MTYVIDTDKRPIPTARKGGFYLTQPRKPWLVSGLIREGTTAFISGKEGTGKSFLALELASCIAEGREFFGNAVNPKDVLYVAAERGDAQRERLEALRDAKGVNPDCITFFDYQFKFNVEADEKLFYEAIETHQLSPRFILIDTLRASFEGDENSSANAQQTMDAFTRIKRKYDATVVVIHHVNAFGQSRGSSAFIGAADTELYVTNSKKTGKVFMTVRKQNNGKNWLRYTLIPQELDFGDDYTSIVLNLEGTEGLENAPEHDDEDVSRDNNIISVVDNIGEKISLYKLSQELFKLEGSYRNKTKLKEDVIRLAKSDMLTFEQLPGNKFHVGPVEVLGTLN